MKRVNAKGLVSRTSAWILSAALAFSSCPVSVHAEESLEENGQVAEEAEGKESEQKEEESSEVEVTKENGSEEESGSEEVNTEEVSSEETFGVV